MKVDLSAHYSFAQLCRVSLPCMVTMIVSSLYSIVDGLFVSNFAGETAFAAVNMVFPLLMIVGTVGIMIGTGGSALVAKTMGEGYNDKAQQIFSTLVIFITIAGIVGTALLLAFMPMFSRAIGATGVLLESCITYGRLCAIGITPQMLQMAFQSFYMTAERPQLGTAMSIACGLTNIALDALLVGWLSMGVTGAAIATVAASTLGGLFPLLYFTSHNNESRLHIVRTAMQWKAVWKAASNGISEYVSSISMSVVSVCYNLQLMRFYGEDGVAAYGVVMYVIFIFAAIAVGFNIGTAPLISYHYGANNRDELRSLYRKDLLFMVLAGVVMLAIAEATSRPLITLFVGYKPELLTLTLHGYRVYLLCFLVDGIVMFISSLFTALNNGLVSAIISFVRTIGFELPCVWILPMVMGAEGIWWSINVSEVLATGVAFAFAWRLAPRYGYR